MSKHTHTQNKRNIFNLILHYLEKYSGAAQQLAHRGWGGANRQEAFLTGAGRGGGRRWGEGPLVIGDGGQAAVSLTPDVHVFERLQLEGLYVGTLRHNIEGT